MSDGGVASPAATPASSTAALRQANVATVARLLFLDGPLTRSEVGRRTGLARPTVQAVLQDLLADGTIREQRLDEPGRPGRPATSLSFDERRASVVACRRRDDRVELQLADLRGAVLATTTVTPTPPLPELGPAVARAVADLAATVPDAGPVGAIAVCVPGVVDRTGGRTTVTDPTRGWRAEPIPELLEAALGVPACVLTPAAAALAGVGWEHRRAVRAHLADGGEPVTEARAALLVFLDHGIAASACVDRRAVFGAGGDGGEIGHHVVVADGDPCPCGRRGCLETVAAGWAVRRRVAQLRPAVGPGPSTLGGFEALGRADVDAVLDGAATALGEHVAVLVTALEPGWVLLGGTDFAAGATRFLATFRAAVEARRARVGAVRTGYLLAPPDADLVGAVRTGLDLLPRRLRAAIDT